MNKWEQFDNLMRCKHNQEEHIQFSPLLMHFAARFIGKTYAEFASDHKVLVEGVLTNLILILLVLYPILTGKQVHLVPGLSM